MAAREEAPPDALGKAEAGPAPGTVTLPAFQGGESAIKSPLEKPLGELTEEDIAQVTREDCRRFLKEKGMRRPSWNKSQAIQQVISLKALLEGRHDEAPSTSDPSIPAFFARRPPEPPVPITAPQVPISPPLGSPRLLPRVDPAAAEPQIAPAGNAPSPCHRREPALPGFSTPAGSPLPPPHRNPRSPLPLPRPSPPSSSLPKPRSKPPKAPFPLPAWRTVRRCRRRTTSSSTPASSASGHRNPSSTSRERSALLQRRG